MKKRNQQCLRSGDALGPTEQKVFSKSHTEIMAELLTKWQISSSVSGPLEHVHHSFSMLEMLSDQERVRVELVKLAILVGRIAVGPWQPWDSVEFPPSSVLNHLRIQSVAEIVAATRHKCGIVSRTSRSESNEETQSIGYWTPSGEQNDLLAEMLRATGICLIRNKIEHQSIVVANCLENDSSKLAGQIDLSITQGLRIITTEANHLQFSDHADVLTTPTSFQRMRETVVGSSGHDSRIDTVSPT